MIRAPIQADFIVCCDLRLPNMKAHFVAALTGAVVCSDLLDAGPVVAYHASMSISRRVWISDRFMAENPLLSVGFLTALSLPSS